MATSAAISQTPAIPKRRFGGDEVAYGVTLLFALSIIAVTVFLVAELWQHSSLTRNKFGFGFIGSKLWNPVTQ